ncbi:MAG: hypothetical protein ACLQIB_21640 [Isosphaeraceae bacterium]
MRRRRRWGHEVVVITLRVMVFPHGVREDYFKEGKENGALAEAAR